MVFLNIRHVLWRWLLKRHQLRFVISNCMTNYTLKSHEIQWYQRSMQLMVKVVFQIYQWSWSASNWINLYISNIFWLHCTDRIDIQICHLESQYNDVTQGFMRHKLPALRQFVDEVISRNGPTKNKIIHEKTLQWRHNECDGVSNYRRLHFCSSVGSAAYQRKHHGSALLAFVRGIHRWPVKGQ